MLGQDFNIQPGSLQLCSRLHILLVLSLMSARGERLGPSQVFQVHAHTALHVHTCAQPFRFPEMCQGFLNSSMDISFPNFFFNACFTSGSHDVKQWQLIVFNKSTQGKGFIHWAIFQSGKSCQVESYRDSIR